MKFLDETLAEDVRFDSQLPYSLQLKSDEHFTSVEVARRVVTLLEPTPGMTILDVGSGVGKFCITAARAMPHAHFVGVEWRPHFVELANRLAQEARLANVQFIHGNAMDLDWRRYDAFYMFNPFGEHEFDPAFVLDNTIDFNPDNFRRHVAGTRQRLARTGIGTRLVTYHGFGAPPPRGYELVTREAFGRGSIDLWVKTQSSLVEATGDEIR